MRIPQLRQRDAVLEDLQGQFADLTSTYRELRGLKSPSLLDDTYSPDGSPGRDAVLAALADTRADVGDLTNAYRADLEVWRNGGDDEGDAAAADHMAGALARLVKLEGELKGIHLALAGETDDSLIAPPEDDESMGPFVCQQIARAVLGNDFFVSL